jgi:hypothetical protein
LLALLGTAFETIWEETRARSAFLRPILIVSGCTGITRGIITACIAIGNALFACKVLSQRVYMMLEIVAFLTFAAKLGFFARFAISDSTSFTSLSIPEISG